MTCAFNKELLDGFVDAELAPTELAEVERHAATCDECRRELAELRKAVEQLRGLPRLNAPRSVSAEIAKAIAPAQRRGYVRWMPASLAAALAVAFATVLIVQSGPGTVEMARAPEEPLEADDIVELPAKQPARMKSSSDEKAAKALSEGRLSLNESVEEIEYCVLAVDEATTRARVEAFCGGWKAESRQQEMLKQGADRAPQAELVVEATDAQLRELEAYLARNDAALVAADKLLKWNRSAFALQDAMARDESGGASKDAFALEREDRAPEPTMEEKKRALAEAPPPAAAAPRGEGGRGFAGKSETAPSAKERRRRVVLRFQALAPAQLQDLRRAMQPR